MSQLIKVVHKDSDINRIQDNVSIAVQQLFNKDIVNGNLLKAISLSANTPNTISHKLGRELSGYIIVMKSTNCALWDSQASNSNKTKTLIINSDTDVTVSIWVF